MRALIWGALVFISAVSASGKSYDCLSVDQKVSVQVRPKGTAIEGGIPSTVEVRNAGDAQIYGLCEQRYTQMHEQEIIGITCEPDKKQSTVSIGIFLPELDGFIELADQNVIDIQCKLISEK
jgi:hypothetical protein